MYLHVGNNKIIREKNQLKNEQKFEIGFGDLEQMSNMEDEESDKKINNFVFVSKQKCSCCNAEMFYYDTVKKKLCINDLNRDYCTIQCPYCQKENPVAITVVVINKKTNLFRKLTFKLMTLSTIYEDDWLEDKIVRDHYYRENFARYWSIMWYCSSKFPMMFLLEKVNINPVSKTEGNYVRGNNILPSCGSSIQMNSSFNSENLVNVVSESFAIEIDKKYEEDMNILIEENNKYKK